jgi:hypothetical protein
MTVYCLLECLIDDIRAEFPYTERATTPVDLARLDAVYAALKKRATVTMLADARAEDLECAKIAAVGALVGDSPSKARDSDYITQSDGRRVRRVS